MAIDRAAIERIDSTLPPQLDRHHLRLLNHCLDSFQSVAAPGSTGAIPDENQRRRWCQQQPVVADDPAFLDTLLLQLNAGVVAFGDLRKAFVALEQFLHNDEGGAGFGAAMQQVVLAAL